MNGCKQQEIKCRLKFTNSDFRYTVERIFRKFLIKVSTAKFQYYTSLVRIVQGTEYCLQNDSKMPAPETDQESKSQMKMLKHHLALAAKVSWRKQDENV